MSKIVFDGRLSTKEPQKPPCLAHICGFPHITSIAMRSYVGHRPLELATTTGKPVHSRAGIRNVISIVHTGRVLLWHPGPTRGYLSKLEVSGRLAFAARRCS